MNKCTYRPGANIIIKISFNVIAHPPKLIIRAESNEFLRYSFTVPWHTSSGGALVALTAHRWQQRLSTWLHTTVSCPPSCSGAQNLMGCPGWMPLMLPSFPRPLLFRSYSLNVCNLKLSYFTVPYSIIRVRVAAVVDIYGGGALCAVVYLFVFTRSTFCLSNINLALPI